MRRPGNPASKAWLRRARRRYEHEDWLEAQRLRGLRDDGIDRLRAWLSRHDARKDGCPL